LFAFGNILLKGSVRLPRHKTLFTLLLEAFQDSRPHSLDLRNVGSQPVQKIFRILYDVLECLCGGVLRNTMSQVDLRSTCVEERRTLAVPHGWRHLQDSRYAAYHLFANLEVLYQ